MTAPVDDTEVSGMDWRHHAVCVDEDPELFFPVGTSGPALAQLAEAKAVCQLCPVSSECLDWALRTGQDWGVWGGLSEDERRALKRRGVRKRVVAQEHCSGSGRHRRTDRNTRIDPGGHKICMDCDSQRVHAAVRRDHWAEVDARDVAERAAAGQ